MGSSSLPLIGRDDEVARLLAALGVDQGTGGVAVVEGEAGIGKSALAAEVQGRLGIASLVGRGEEQERGRPFHLFRALLDLRPGAEGRAGQLARTLDRPAPSGDLTRASASTWAQAGDAVLALVEERARHPLLLVAEDVHWGDVQSLALLRHVATLTTDRPVSLLITSRPTGDAEVADLVERLITQGADRLRLGPLDDQVINELLRSELGARPGLRLQAMAARSGGNPLILSQLLTGLRAEDALVEQAGTVETRRGTETPESLRGSIRRRLTGLDRSSAELVRVASIIGSRFTVADLGHLLGQRAVEMTGAIGQAVEAGLFVDLDTELGFRHDLVRDAVYHELPPALRRELHRELAAVRRRAGEPPIRVAEHVAHGLEPGDEAAVDEVRAAVAAIAYRAPRVALDLLDRAARASADHRDLIDIERIEPRAWLGEIDGAAADAEDLLRSGLVPSTRRPALRSILAGLRVLQHRTTEAVEQFELGLQECDDDRLRARLGAQSAMARMSAGAFGDAAEEAAQARRLAIDVGDDGARSMAAGILGRLSTYTNDWTSGLGLVEEAVAAADADHSGEAHRFLPWFFCGVTRLEMGQVEGATQALTRGMDRALELETEWALPLYHALAAAIAWRTGRWDEALVEAGSSRRAAEDTGTVVANAWMLAIEATVHLQRDDLDEAADALEAAGALVAEGEALLGVDVLSLAGALVAEARGEGDEARAELAGAWDLLAAVGVPSAQTVLGVDLVRLATEGGRHRPGPRHVRRPVGSGRGRAAAPVRGAGGPGPGLPRPLGRHRVGCRRAGPGRALRPRPLRRPPPPGPLPGPGR